MFNGFSTSIKPMEHVPLMLMPTVVINLLQLMAENYIAADANECFMQANHQTRTWMSRWCVDLMQQG